jgi:manganese transport protein
MQLPLAMFPLMHFTSSKKRMGAFRNGWFLLATGWTSAVLITVLDLYGLPESIQRAWAVIAGN